MEATPGETAVEEHTGDVAGVPLVSRSAPSSTPPVPYLHGVPTSSDDWLAVLARTGGLAPDLPGFGRSGKRGDWDYSIAGYDRFLEAFLDHLDVERFSLVAHDWGAVGLALAQRMPERMERLVIVNCVPLLPGYRWHWIARVWRRPGLGQLAMGAVTRRGLRYLFRATDGRANPLAADLIDRAWAHFDQGTQRAILRLYRSTPPEALARAGRHLEEIEAPALVVWGERDPYLPVELGRSYAGRLPGAQLRAVPGAGHWPWLDEPALIDEICEFLG